MKHEKLSYADLLREAQRKSLWGKPVFTGFAVYGDVLTGHPDYVMSMPRVSADHPGMLLHYPNMDRFLRDIPEPVKVGRYVTNFMPHMSAFSRDWTAALTPEHMFLADTREAIRGIYLSRGDGTRSCMTHSNKELGLETFGKDLPHPTEAYAAGDLAVAYINGTACDVSAEGKAAAALVRKPTARCVVWPERKIHGRIYGDSSRMERALHINGYKSGADSIGGSAWHGARLLKLPLLPAGTSNIWSEAQSFIVPYFDAEVCAVDTGEYLQVVNARECRRESGDVFRYNGTPVLQIRNAAGWTAHHRCSKCRCPVEFGNFYYVGVYMDDDGQPPWQFSLCPQCCSDWRREFPRDNVSGDRAMQSTFLFGMKPTIASYHADVAEWVAFQAALAERYPELRARPVDNTPYQSAPRVVPIPAASPADTAQLTRTAIHDLAVDLAPYADEDVDGPNTEVVDMEGVDDDDNY